MNWERRRALAVGFMHAWNIMLHDKRGPQTEGPTKEELDRVRVELMLAETSDFPALWQKLKGTFPMLLEEVEDMETMFPVSRPQGERS